MIKLFFQKISGISEQRNENYTISQKFRIRTKGARALTLFKSIIKVAVIPFLSQSYIFAEVNQQQPQTTAKKP